MTVMRFEAGGRQLRADFARPLSIAVPLDFSGPQPSCFGAPPATSRPLFDLGSCHCELLTLAPHCNGTHTECVGHLTDERVAIAETLRGGVLFALLVSIEPTPSAAGDRLVTAAALRAACSRHAGPAPNALVIRTAGAGEVPARAYHGPAPAPYLSRQAAAWLVEQGIEHLVLDLPSADRADDGGRLAAHRVFFGLPAGSRQARDAKRPHATITELAWIESGIADGFYLLDLQIPAFLADAAPSRPLLYPVQFE